MKRICKGIILFGIGGLLYILIELLWRGYTHWTMFLVGGLCFLLIGGLNNWYPWEMSIIQQMAISAVIVTVVEFLSGCIINLWLGWHVWDYSDMPFNVMGQICLLFTVLWFLLSLVAIILDDFLRYILFNEEKPHYKIST